MIKLQRIIRYSAPANFLRRKSKAFIVPGFSGLPLYDVAKFFKDQLNKRGLNERAAAISFNFIMAIPAACICIFTIVPYLPISKEFNLELLKLTKQISPNRTTYFFIKEFLDDFFDTQRGGLLSFGLLLVLFYASNAMMGVIRAFDKSIAEKKGWFLDKRLRAIKLTFILFILIIGAILILIGQEQLAILLKKLFHLKKKANLWGWSYLRWIIIITLIFYGIALIYKYAPSVKKRWELLSPGAILATFLLILTTLIFSYWVNNFSNFNKLYGSVGTVLIIMNIVFFNSMVLLIGFELNVSITYLQKEVEQRKLNDNGIDEKKLI